MSRGFQQNEAGEWEPFDDELEFESPPPKRVMVGHLMQWHLIETAPKGEQHLLLWGGGRVYEGYWGGKNWYALYDEDMIARPTHWTPLPPPPRIP